MCRGRRRDDEPCASQPGRVIRHIHPLSIETAPRRAMEKSSSACGFESQGEQFGRGYAAPTAAPEQAHRLAVAA